MPGLHQCPHCLYKFEDQSALDAHLNEGSGCPSLGVARHMADLNAGVTPLTDPPSYKSLFQRLFEEVAACEAPEGTQVDDVLAACQLIYNRSKEA
jgi:hypothetical protein